MVDKQQLAAIGEHMREIEECDPRITQDARIGGVVFKAGIKVSTVIEAAYRAAEFHQPNPKAFESLMDSIGRQSPFIDFKVPDGWRLVPIEITDEMEDAAYKEIGSPSDWYGFGDAYRVMISAAPEYKP